jgi:putative protease
MLQKPELLAPAGTLEKAKIALLYGADAVYVGGEHFSLRARASNFTLDNLKELALFAQGLQKKVYVTTNIIPHDNDFEGLKQYLQSLQSFGINAIITSSLKILACAKEYAPKLERHLSTQMSILNSQAISFYREKAEVSRVVLAREASLEEIRLIKNHTPLELEVFIHGGMCSSFSGRCVLSNHFTSRDANRGGCAHSCRWNYHLYDGKRKLGHSKTYFNMGSKDMMALSVLPDLMEVGVTSLKIEGRMKSSYYLATVISGYRHFIDEYVQYPEKKQELIEKYTKEIHKAENRETSIGFYAGDVKVEGQLYDSDASHPSQEYVGDVLNYQNETQVATICVRNYFQENDLLEVFGPIGETREFTCRNMWQKDPREKIQVANKPLVEIELTIPFVVYPGEMIRLVQSGTKKSME